MIIEQNKNANLEKVFKSIKKSEINQNKNWYKTASIYANYLSNKFCIDYDKICGVISALSPACSWSQNKKDTEKMIFCYANDLNYNDFNFSTYGANVGKAWSILKYNGKDILNSFFSLKTGSKTYNFFMNILQPENNNFVTIDRHAIAIFLGQKKSGSKAITPKQYRDIANVYIESAANVGLLPCQFQAILWSNHVKNILGN